MLLQTNSYIVPRETRSEHARLLRKFRHTLLRLGCDQFEVYEQVGTNWSGGEASGRFVQIMRFRDRKHQQEVQAAEKSDAAAQQFIGEFCAMINFPYQQQQGLFAVGFYRSALPIGSRRGTSVAPPQLASAGAVARSEADGAAPDAPVSKDRTAEPAAAETVAPEAVAPDGPAPAEPLPLDLPLPAAALPAQAEGALIDGEHAPARLNTPDAIPEPAREDPRAGEIPRREDEGDVMLAGLTFDAPEPAGEQPHDDAARSR